VSGQRAESMGHRAKQMMKDKSIMKVLGAGLKRR